MGEILDNFMNNVTTGRSTGTTGDGVQDREQPVKTGDTDVISGDDGQVNMEGFDLDKLPEDRVFEYLTGKAGREIKTWEDLNKREEVIKEVQVEKPLGYSSPDVEMIDKFVRETGRGVEDYFKVQKNWDEVSDDKVIKEYVKSQYPSLDDEEIEALFREQYSETPVSDDMDEMELRDINQKNRARKASMKMEAQKARSYFNSQKEQYKAPVKRAEDVINEGKKAWSENMLAALEGVKDMEVDGFKYEFRDRDNYKRTFKDMESLMEQFKKDGVMDYALLARTIIAGKELPKILEEHAKAVRANTIEEEMKKKSNAGGDVKREPTTADYQDYVRKSIFGDRRR